MPGSGETGSSSVIVGVIDSGIDVDHPDLINNLWVNTGEIWGDGIDNDGNGYIDDYNGYDFVRNAGIGPGYAYDDEDGHGTHVAGTIAAEGNNGIGVVGVAWDAQLMAAKFLDANGDGFTFNAVRALQYTTANGAQVTNNSWGGSVAITVSCSNAINDARLAGNLFVAGCRQPERANNDSTPHFPSNYTHDNVIAVASTTSSDGKSGFSNYGAITVDLAAPGSSIYSTTMGGGYGYKSGTSMAAPHVTGAIALMLAADPTLSYTEIRDALFNSVDPVSSMNGITTTGGRLNVDAALAAIMPAEEAFAPVVVSADSAAAVTEQSESAARITHTRSGTIDFTDANIADAHVVSVVPAGSYLGSFGAIVSNVAQGDGVGEITWTYSVDDASLDALAAGETVVQSYTVTIRDSANQEVSQQVDITLTGANDAPEITIEESGLSAGLYFNAFDGSDRTIRRLNKDGSVDLVGDVPDYQLGSLIPPLVEHRGSLYTVGRHTTGPNSLYRIAENGTPQQINGVSDIGADATVFNGSLYFRGHSSAHGHELREIDSDGNLVTHDLRAGSANSAPGWFTEHDNALYFAATPGSGTANRGNLWRINADGAMENVSAGAPGLAVRDARQFASFDNALHFVAISDEYELDLFRYDDDGSISLVHDFLGGVQRVHGEFNGSLYLTAATDAPAQYEMLRLDTDGTITQIGSGLGHYTANGYAPISSEFNGEFYFNGDDDIYKINRDGNLEFVSTHHVMTNFEEFDGALYYEYLDELYKIDSDGIVSPVSLGSPGLGTDYQPTLFAVADNVVEGGETLNIQSISLADVDAGASILTVALQVGHGTLSLSASSGLTFTDVDGSDGTLAFTGTLADLNNALDSGVNFTADSGYSGDDTLNISVTDAQGASATATQDITVTDAGAPPATPNEKPEISIDGYSGELYFTSQRTDGSGQQALHRLTTDGQVQHIRDLTLSRVDGYFVGGIYQFVDFDGDLHFGFGDATTGNELYKLDSDDSFSLVADLEAGDSSSNARSYTVLNGSLYFIATTSATGGAVFQLAPDGTVTAHEFAPGSQSFNPRSLTLFNDALYFDGYDSETAPYSQLFRLNADGTQENVSQSRTGAEIWNPQKFTVFNNELYFRSWTSATGTELFKLTADGTASLVADIETGTESSVVTPLIEYADSLYLTAETDASGEQFYRMDANGNLTQIGNGIAPSGRPGALAVFDGELYFDGAGDVYKIGADNQVTQISALNMTGDFVRLGGALYFQADGLLYRIDKDDTVHEVDLSASGIVLAPGSTLFTHGYAPPDLSTEENTPLSITNISLSDADLGSGEMRLTLSVVNGTLALASTTGLTMIDGDGSDGTVVVSGTLAALNAALSAGVTYTPSTGFNGEEPLNILVDDGAGGTASEKVTLTVKGALTGILLPDSSVDENDAGAIVGALGAEGGDGTVTYEITSDPGGYFEIRGNNLALRDGVSLDHENAASHNVTIRATDTSDGDVSTTFEIAVGDVNEAPTIDFGVNSTTGMIDLAGQPIFFDLPNFDFELSPLPTDVVLLPGPAAELTLGDYEPLPGGPLDLQDFPFVDFEDFFLNGSFGSFAEFLTLPGQVGVPVESGPTLTTAGAVTDEDTPITFDAITVGDPEDDPLSLDVSVAHGALSLSSTTGLTFTDADGSDGTLAFSGTLTDLNAAFAGGLIYTPDTGYSGLDTLTIAADDGNGGVATQDMTVTVNGADEALPNQSPTIDFGLGSPEMYFAGDHADTGIELYKMSLDGTISLVSDINPGAARAFVNDYAAFNDSLYFRAYEPSTGEQLYKMAKDGTVSRVTESDIVTGGPIPTNMTEFNGDLYLSAQRSDVGRELFKLDADGNMVLVADINPGSDSGGAGGFTEFDDALYFSADDGVHGRELYRLNGDGSIDLVADIDTTSGAGSYPRELTDFNGVLHFIAENEIYRLNADGTVEVVADTKSGSGGAPRDLQVFGDSLYFRSINDQNYHEIGRLQSDGTLTEVLIPGNPSSNPGAFTEFNGELYFRSKEALYKIRADHTVAQVAGSGFSNWVSTEMQVFNGSLYISDSSKFFRVDADGTVNDISGDGVIAYADHGFVLFESNPGGFEAVESTPLIIDSISIADSDGGSLSVEISVANGTLTFGTTTGLTFTDADGSDGTLAFSGNISDLNAAFAAGLTYTSDDGYEGSDTLTLVADDGTAPVTTETADILVSELPPAAPSFGSGALTGSVSEASDGSPEENVVVHSAAGAIDFSDVNSLNTHTASVIARGRSYLGALNVDIIDPATGGGTGSVGWTFEVHDSALDSLAEGEVLTQIYDVTITDSDGLSVTQSVVISVTGAADGALNQAPIIDLGAGSTEMYFSGDNADTGIELYKMSTDGTISLVSDINPGSPPSYAIDYASFNGSLYFRAWNMVDGGHLYKMSRDGTVSRLTDPALPAPIPLKMREFGGELYISAQRSDVGRELFKLSADEKLELVADIRPGSDSSGVGESLTEFDGALYFGADDGVHGSELHRLNADGSIELVADIDSAPGVGANPRHLTEFNGTLYFRAFDELYRLKGDDTVEFVADTKTVGLGGAPKDLQVFGDSLYFSAGNNQGDREIWRLQTDGTLTEVTIPDNPNSDPDAFEEFNGELYFRSNSALYKIRADHTVELVAGSGFSDWADTEMQVFNGALYVSDEFKFFRVDAGGTVNDISGDGVVAYSGHGHAFVLFESEAEELEIDEFTSLFLGQISITDPDGGSLSLEISVANGALTFGNTTGLTFTDADGSDGTLAFSGNIFDLNAAFASGLTYTPESGFNGAETLTITADDGAGGVTTETLDITVLDNGIDETNQTGTMGADALRGTAAADVLAGLDGDDALEGGDGADMLDGGAGDDRLFGERDWSPIPGSPPAVAAAGAGGAVSALASVTAAGDDQLFGREGADTLTGGDGGDLLDGGDGFDVASYADANAGVTANLADSARNTGYAAGDTYVDIEGLEGSVFGDELTGDTGDNMLDGGDGNDWLYGGLGADGLIGGAGTDYLIGQDGADILDGGDGSDFAYYFLSGAGLTADLLYQDRNTGEAAGDRYISIENLAGSYYEDLLRGDNTSNQLQGLAGDDMLAGESGDDTLFGNDGADTLSGGYGDDLLLGGGDNDALFGNDGRDGLYGDDGDDWLYGGAGDDGLYAGAGNDFLIGEAGADLLNGGAGIDTALYYFSSSAVNAQLWNASFNTGDAAGDQYVDIENLTGTYYDDILHGDAGDNQIQGLAGDDMVAGEAGNDTLFGNDGADTMSGGLGDDLVLGGHGNDTLFGNGGRDGLYGDDGNDWLYGGAGDDGLYAGAGDDFLIGEGGADLLDGGAGIDTVLYYFSSSAVNAQLWNASFNTGDAAGDQYVDIENLTGTYYDDILHGDAGDNQIQGLAGDDMVAGEAGNDTLFGNDGADTMSGGLGDDLVLGGHGNDTLFGNGGRDGLYGDDGNDWLYGGAGDDGLYAGAGDDFLIGEGGADLLDGGAGIDTAMYSSSGAGVVANLTDETANTGDAAGDQFVDIENLSGTDFNDTLTGDGADNQLQGMSGNDVLTGEGGDDSIFGDDGADTLNGGAGSDYLNGGNDNDVLSGNSGDDTLFGGTGDDDYMFGRGDGADMVANHGETASDDTVIFGAAIESDQLWFAQSGNDLTVSVIGTTDSVTISDWYDGTSNRLDFATAGGESLADSSVQALVEAMAGFAPPAIGETDLNPAASYYDSVSALIANSWQSP